MQLKTNYCSEKQTYFEFFISPRRRIYVGDTRWNMRKVSQDCYRNSYDVVLTKPVFGSNFPGLKISPFCFVPWLPDEVYVASIELHLEKYNRLKFGVEDPKPSHKNFVSLNWCRIMKKKCRPMDFISIHFFYTMDIYIFDCTWGVQKPQINFFQASCDFNLT